MAEIKNRTLEYLKARGLTKQNFCEKTGISYPNMTGKSLKSEFGGDQIYEILCNFPELNPDWLLLGRGEMLRPANQQVGNISHSTAVGVNVSGNGININQDQQQLLSLIAQQQQTIARQADTIADLTALLKTK